MKSTANDSLINQHNSAGGEAYQRGAQLIASNDCITCHAVNEKNIGPSFSQIASRYHNDQKYATFLTNSVVRGSKGAWGEHEMTPHPQIPVVEIEEMVHYILSVKTAKK